MKKRFSKVIIAKHLFDGINEKDYEGYLCLSGNHIVEKKAGKPVGRETGMLIMLLVYL